MIPSGWNGGRGPDPATVLVVDQDKEQACGLQRIIAALPSKPMVMYAGTGREALFLAFRHGVQVVLTAADLPDMAGRTLLAKLSAAKMAPAGLLVGGGTEGAVGGVGDFFFDRVVKPIEAGRLRLCVELALDRHALMRRIRFNRKIQDLLILLNLAAAALGIVIGIA